MIAVILIFAVMMSLIIQAAERMISGLNKEVIAENEKINALIAGEPDQG